MVGDSFPLQGDLGFNDGESTAGSEFNLEDLSVSIADSFLDFEYIKDWIEDDPEPQKGMATDLGESHSPLSSEIAYVGAVEVGPAGFGDKIEAENVEFVVNDKIKVEEVEAGSVNGVGTESGLVSAYDGGGDDKESKNEGKVDVKLESVSEAQSSASSSSSESSSSESESESESESSSDDDDDGKRMVKEVDGELEEGEILSHELEEMMGWSDDEDGTRVAAGVPQRSKNEITVLPPVPPVTATLQPHHQILPVGVVLSVLGVQVIVEGVEKHSPLNEGSILWITESGSPLGIVDEIFGPVKNPYYIVRYNTESEVPSGIEPGSSISFVPEFADHVLNDKNLYQKGYDRSGPNDEEVVEDEEFSDDEKEAEYKKMLKNKKRGKNDERPGNNNQNTDENKFTNRSRNWKSDSSNNTQKPEWNKQQHVNPPRHMQPSSSQMDQCSPCPHQAFAPQPFPQFGAFPGGANGMIPFQQPQNVGLQQMAPNGMPQLMQQMSPMQFFQMPMENRFPFQQQMNGPNLPPNQPGFSSGPPFLPWGFGQNPFMTSLFGMGLPHAQPASLPMSVGQQAPPFQLPAPVPVNAGQQAPPPFQQQAPVPVNADQEAPPKMHSPSDSPNMHNPSSQPDSSQSFNHGNKQFGGRGGGRFRGGKQHRRGGGRFRGGRGGQNSG